MIHWFPNVQVIGPSAAAKWLQEVAPYQQLRYRFMHCSQLNKLDQTLPGELGHTGELSALQFSFEANSVLLLLVARHIHLAARKSDESLLACCPGTASSIDWLID